MRWTEERVLLYTRALVFAVLAAWIAMVASSARTLWTPQGEPLGADFVVFHAAGRAVARGEITTLFSPNAMRTAQAHSLGMTSLTAAHAWVYPPFYAALLVPIGVLPFVPALLLYTAILVAFAWLATRHVRALAPSINVSNELLFYALLLFYPVLRATFGGQNTALSLCLLAGAGAAVQQNKPREAGVWLGILWLKPHFAMVALWIALCAGRLHTVAVALLVGVGWYVLGAIVAGFFWPLRWMESVANYRQLEANANGKLLISLLGVAEQLFGVGSLGAKLALLVSALVLFGVGVLAFLSRKHPERWTAIWSLGIAALVLCSPHTQFYDLGLMAVVGVVAREKLGSKATPWIAFLWIACIAHGIFTQAPVQPLFFVALGGMLLAIETVRSTWKNDVLAGATE